MIMIKEQAKKRLEQLRSEIDDHRYRYNILDKPVISDAAYDSLFHELTKIEEQYPDLITAESPSQRVGAKPAKKFEKIRHSTRMLSINDVFDYDELKKWQERLIKLGAGKAIERSGYFVELKMDGLAVSLVYDKGILKLGATRGNGTVGENVTQNLKTVDAIPLRLRHPRENGDPCLAGRQALIVDSRLPGNDRKKGEDGKKDEQGSKNERLLYFRVVDNVADGRFEARGEAFLSKSDFEKLNTERKKKGLPIYANPRNIAAGSIRQLNSKITAERDLDFFVYATPTKLGLEFHHQEHQIASALGFKTNKNNKICKDIGEVEEYLKYWDKAREKLPYQTDGVVVILDDKKEFERLGSVGKAPRGMIAYKFPAEEATSVIKDIIVNVGRTGKLTPVAIMEPTLVAGSTVSRATLHNADEIDRKDIKIGDTVIIRKAGDVIPEVVSPIKKMRRGDEKKFKMPHKCPICGGRIVKKSGEVDYYCADKNCVTRQHRQLEFFVAKNAFDIEGMGPKIVEQLMQEGLLHDPSDIFELREGDLKPLERFADKSSSNLIESIEKSKNIPLERFIYALGIRHVGAETAVDLARQFGTIENILKSERGEFDSIYGVGEKVSESITEWLADRKNIELISKLQKLNVKILSYHSPVLKNKLAGKSFVVTGSLKSMPRDDAHKKIVQNGGKISSSVTSNTDYLIAGDEPGSKLDKAKRFGTKILSEKEFLKMIS